MKIDCNKSQKTQNEEGMNDPEKYSKSNDNQFNAAKHALEKYGHKFSSPKNPTVFDIGCADGRVTEFLLSKLPKTFEKLVAIDRSPNMIKFAANKHKHPKLEFKQFEWAVDDYTQLPKADHITSFTVFHWMPNMPKSFQDIYDMLKWPNGDCLLVFVTKSKVEKILEDFKQKNPKWAAYTNQPFVYKTQPYVESILKDSKFSYFTVENYPQPYYFKDFEAFKSKLI